MLYTNNLSAQTTKITIKLKLSHTLLSTTSVQLFSKRGGLCFPWRLFSLGGGGGGLESTRHWGGGGWVGHVGVSYEEFGVDKGGGGGLMQCIIKGVGGGGFMVW